MHDFNFMIAVRFEIENIATFKLVLEVNDIAFISIKITNVYKSLPEWHNPEPPQSIL